jgi:hypothetical protein
MAAKKQKKQLKAAKKLETTKPLIHINGPAQR